jgi:hypothetical protein
VQGVPRSCAFDAESGTFRFVFDADATLHAPTEMFVPPAHFGAGFVVEAPGCAVHHVGGTVLHLMAHDSGERVVTIRRTSGGSSCAVSLH